jgi:carboxylesterase
MPPRMSHIISTAEPFLVPGSRTGCLLIHGFTGTPKEMRWMGEYLAQQGFSVLGIRLAGHATQPEDMLRSRWTDWLASAEDGYHLLKGFADRIYLIGLSMGGVLSLLLSARLPVKGVIAMSTPYDLPADWRLNYLWLFSRLMPYLPKSKRPPGSGWFDKLAWQDHVSYPQNPTRSIGELRLLLAAMRAALPQVQVPVLLIHSENDRYVLPENTDRILAALVNAPDKSRLLVRNSGHVVTRDAARQQLFDAALQFILHLESGAS